MTAEIIGVHHGAMSESTEHVTIVPAALCDELMKDDATPESNANLRDAARRVREVIVSLDSTKPPA